jgi:transcriptional antiterminator RfaH
MKRWYAAQTQPRKERLAIEHLERQSYATHCPFVRRMTRRAGRSIAVLEPLFPGYVFVGIDCDRQRWLSINSTIGVSRLVSFSNRPSPLPAGFVEQLRGLADADGQVCFEERLAAGDTVRIVGGPFDSLCGTLATSDARQRVTVLLQLLAGETRVSLPRECLVAA